MTTANFFARYHKTRVLVTGLTGFKGQWLGRWLKRLGAEVTGLGLAPTADPHGRAPDFAGQFDCRLLDVRDLDAVERLFRQSQPEIVFHLAAQPLVRHSYAEPVETFATNVMGTVHVLEAARRTPSVRAVVNVTSDKCYENREWHWAYREDEPMGGHDPYSASKGCAELVTAAFRRSYASAQTGPAIASARAGNVIGGGDWAADRLVPDFVRAIVSGRPLVLRRPASIRPWQHVLEAVSGYLSLGVALLLGDRRFAAAWNFGPSDTESVCVGELAERLVRCWGRGDVQREPTESGPSEARFLKLDSSKSRAELPWEALLSVNERIAWTVQWYRQWHESREHSWQAMDDQIERYEKRHREWLDQKRLSSPASPASSDRRSRAA